MKHVKPGKYNSYMVFRKVCVLDEINSLFNLSCLIHSSEVFHIPTRFGINVLRFESV